MRDPGARWWRLSLIIPDWIQDLIVLFLVEQGTNGVEVLEREGSCTLIAYLHHEDRVASLLSSLRGYLEGIGRANGVEIEWRWDLQEVMGEDWKDAWKTHFRGVKVSPRLAVRPSWEEDIGLNGAVVIEIDPGQAFGTGLHETTRMCLEWIDNMLGENGAPSCAPRPSRGLDVGTGTGILAIAMARLGMTEVWALDTDPVAIEVARGNILVNGVRDRVRVLEGSLEVLGGEVFPLAVANLTGPELAKMVMGWNDCMEPSGFLVASGLLREEKGMILDLYKDAGFDSVGEREEGEWCAMLLRRRR